MTAGSRRISSAFGGMGTRRLFPNVRIINQAVDAELVQSFPRSKHSGWRRGIATKAAEATTFPTEKLTDGEAVRRGITVDGDEDRRPGAQFEIWQEEKAVKMTRRSALLSALGGICGTGALAAWAQEKHPEQPKVPSLEFCFDLFVEIAEPLDLGETPQGHRRIVPITGGHFEGPKLQGEVLSGGADWQVIHPDGTVEIDTRYTLKTKEGFVYIRNAGLRYATPEVTNRMVRGELVKPSEYYFRTNPVFETSVLALHWLTQSFFIGIAERRPRDVSVQVWRVG